MIVYLFILLVFGVIGADSLNIQSNSNGKDCIIKSNNHSVIGLILARGGSKGVYRKNLRKLDGISLLARNIIKLKRSELFAEIWVSTEDDEIATEAKKFGALVHKRPNHLAADRTSSLEAVKDFLNVHLHINKFALFQCTSVFLRQWHIEKAFERFQSAECVFAVARIFKLRWHLNDHQFAVPSNFDPENRPRRQDWNGELVETGMFYFTNRQLIIEQNIFQSDKCKMVVIPEEDSLEIDNENDLKIAEYLLKWR